MNQLNLLYCDERAARSHKKWEWIISYRTSFGIKLWILYYALNRVTGVEYWRKLHCCCSSHIERAATNDRSICSVLMFFTSLFFRVRSPWWIATCIHPHAQHFADLATDKKWEICFQCCYMFHVYYNPVSLVCSALFSVRSRALLKKR